MSLWIEIEEKEEIEEIEEQSWPVKLLPFVAYDSEVGSPRSFHDDNDDDDYYDYYYYDDDDDDDETR